MVAGYGIAKEKVRLRSDRIRDLSEPWLPQNGRNGRSFYRQENIHPLYRFNRWALHHICASCSKTEDYCKANVVSLH